MPTLAKSPRTVKPGRTIRLTVPPSAVSQDFIVTIAQGDATDDYLVRPIPADFGTGYAVQKIFDPEQKSYAVNLNGNDTGSCECKGFLRWGHCRHVSGLLALRRAGKLS